MKTISILRLRIADFLLNLAYHCAPDNHEGRQLRNSLNYAPPWRCHYRCVGGWNVPLREDCPHGRQG